MLRSLGQPREEKGGVKSCKVEVENRSSVAGSALAAVRVTSVAKGWPRLPANIFSLLLQLHTQYFCAFSQSRT